MNTSNSIIIIIISSSIIISTIIITRLKCALCVKDFSIALMVAMDLGSVSEPEHSL